MFAITERLLLRPGWAEDAPALARAMADEQVVRNLSRVPWPYGIEDAMRFLALPCRAGRPRFLIFRRDGAELVGGIGLTDLGNCVEANLGYWITRANWGQGIATEAGRAVLAIADETFRLARVLAGHATDNPASGKVLRKLGFAPRGSDRVHSLGRGGEIAVELFARERAGAATALAA